ncbi:MAG: hypothetical protein PVI30_10040 [Myxococcales bacterium]|jgi:hypothetical protein
MARLLTTCAAAALAFSLLGAPLRGAGQARSRAPALLAIVHPAAGVERMDRNELAAVFTLSLRNWSNGRRAVPFNYAANHPYRVAFDEAVLGMGPEQVARFWITRRVRGQGTAPRTVSSPQLMAKVVARLPGAVGYVPHGVKAPGAVVVARVEGGRVVPVK